MAFPTPDSYSCQPGGSIVAGRSRRKSGDVVIIGDSLTEWTPGFPWGMSLAGAPVRFISNAGIASDTIAGVIGRWQADVLDKSPDVVALRIGTNSLHLDAATFQAQYQVLLDSLVANGMFGFVHAIPPRIDSAAVIVQRNAWIAAQCALFPGKLKFVNDSLELGDEGYNFIAAYFADGIHMADKGMHAQGVGMEADYENSLTLVSPLIIDGADTFELNPTSTQYVRNPLMAGAGPVPTNWSFETSGGGTVATPSIIAADVGDLNQTPWFRITVDAMGGDNHWISFATQLMHPAIAADLTIKRLDMVAEVRMSGLQGAAIKGIGMDCSDGSNRPAPGFTLVVPADEILTHSVVMRSAITRGEDYPVVAHAANAIKYGFGLTGRAAQSGGLGTVDIRCVSVRGSTT